MLCTGITVYQHIGHPLHSWAPKHTPNPLYLLFEPTHRPHTHKAHVLSCGHMNHTSANLIKSRMQFRIRSEQRSVTSVRDFFFSNIIQQNALWQHQSRALGLDARRQRGAARPNPRCQCIHDSSIIHEYNRHQSEPPPSQELIRFLNFFSNTI